MAMTRIYRFTTTEEVEAFVNGCVVARLPAPVLYNIVGKSMVFAHPSSTTVTFAEDGMGNDLTSSKAYQQIRDAMPTVSVRTTSMGVLFMEKDPTQGVEITSDTDEEVLIAFGLSQEGAKGTVYTPTAVSSDPPCFLAISGGQGMYDILTYIEAPEEQA